MSYSYKEKLFVILYKEKNYSYKKFICLYSYKGNNAHKVIIQHTHTHTELSLKGQHCLPKAII